ncbi:MAG: flagellar hook-basal body complex protein FliE [Alphaproteobacteria bacterium]|nr:flagellar hook-basal body complex protein FliE [Alphaproteobacteria bacterium]MBO6627520.1 flagellar hook-basal body complex protein FliE [Alphaproteobacteria bacterium]MDF1627163.1 flagellar hook-basal body complex protein FliE [Parvibaculaceae bacterium]
MTVPTSVAMNAYATAARQVAQGAAGDAASSAGGGPAFGDLLRGVVDNMATAGVNAQEQAVSAIGGKGDVVDMVTAISEAEATLQTVVAVRDNVITAYQEILKMPI